MMTNSSKKAMGGGKIGLLFSMLALTVPMQAETSAKIPVATEVEAVQQTMTISGVVKDENGESVPGASVYIKGNNKLGTVTDIDGRFTLKAPAGQTLVVSFIGYQTIEQTLKPGQSFLTLTLIPDDRQLDEVVVTGYQTISKERAAGSFTVLTPEKMEGKMQTNILDRMEGMVAGMKFAPNQSIPEIRGVSTLNGNRSPLYVVDGVPYEGSLDALNPADIVNVTVLKDATAASIYGARSTNGVIVITTRSGHDGKTRVSYDGSVKFTPLPDRGYLNLTSSAELVDLQQTLFNYYHNGITDILTERQSFNEVYTLLYMKEQGVIGDATFEAEMNHYRSLDRYDQIKDAFVRNNSITHQHNISFSGGSKIYKYALSANYQQDLPYEKEQSTQRIGLNLKNQFDFFDWLQMNVGVITSNTNSSYDNGFSGYSNLYGGVTYRMLYNQDGTPAQWYSGKSQYELDRLNSLGLQDETYIPVNEMENAHYTNESKYYNINLGLKVKLMEGLNLNLIYQTENTNNYSKQYYSKDHYSIKSEINDATVIEDDGSITHYFPVGGTVEENWTKQKSYTFRAQLDFNRDFGERHSVQALIGTERRKVESQSTRVYKVGYDDNTLAYTFLDEIEVANGINGTQAISGRYYYYDSGTDRFTYDDNRYVSFYANASYTFDRKLTGTVSVRIDQSNLFGMDPKYKYRPLWSTGAQYVALENWNWIDRLAVRATYGINGNTTTMTSPYMIASVSNRPNTYTNETYATITTPPNPTLRWEKTNQFNLAVDFNLLNHRLNGTIEFYNKKTTDLLGQRQTDPTTGWPSLWLNYGEMYNRGVELTLSSRNIKTRDFSWDTDFIFSYNKNKLTRVEASGTAASDYYYNLQNREGRPMNAMWVIRYAGLDEEGYPTAYKADGTIVKSAGELEAEDLVYAGTTTPPYSASLSNKLSYKGFDLSFMFVYYGGNVLRDVAAGYMWDRYPVLNYASAVDRGRLHFWQQPGDENDPDMAPAFMYRTSHTNSANLWQYADKHVEKGDYIKLRDVTLSYTFPKVWVNKFYAENLRVSLQIQNLFYWAANKRHLDPEVWSGTSSSPSRGYRIPPTYTLGVSLNF